MSSLDFLNIEPSMLKTEERIILAAMKVFALYPIDIVTLRMIAKEADVTLSLITYHFKTKENLYQEVLNRVLGHMTRNIQDRFEISESGRPLKVEEAKSMLRDAIDFFSDCIFANPQSALLAKIIIQEHFSPSEVYDGLYEQYFRRIVHLFERLVAAITGEKDRRRASLRAFSIIGQIIGFRLEREIMVRHLDFKGFSEEETVELKEMLYENALILLGANKKDKRGTSKRNTVRMR